MKKAIIVFLMAGILAGNAFAQITFSGSVYAGIQLRSPDGADETIGAVHREGYSPQFNFTGTVARENYGARLDTTFEATADPGRHFTLNGIYGWVNFLDNSVRLTMGKLSNPAWATNLDARLPTHHLDEITGFRVEYNTPIQGLSVGAAFETANYDVETFFQQIIFGANFVHPLFSTVFAYDLGSNGQAIFGFNYTGFPDLTLGIQLRANNLASWDNEFMHFGSLLMHQKIGYRVTRSVFAYLILGQGIYGSPHVDTYLEFTPGVDVRLTPELTGTFRMTIDSPDHFTTTNLTLRPSIEYTLRGPAVLYVEYELRLADMDRATHTFGFGITIRAF